MSCHYKYKGKIYSESEILEKLGKDNSKEIKERLFPILHSMGITVTSLEQYEQITGKNLDNDIIALADSLNMLIAVNDKKADETTLPEELMHLAIAQQGLPDGIKSLVAQTSEFKQWSQTYLEKYNNNIDLVLSEIAGKIGAEVLIKKIKRESDYRLVRGIKRLWEKFKSLFVSKNELHRYLDSISQDVLDNKIKLQPIETPIMYQVDSKYEKTLSRAINSLRLRVKAIKSRGLSHGEELKELQEIEKKLKDKENIEGLLLFLKSMSKNSERANKYINKVTEGKEKISAKKLQQLGDFLAYYEPYLHELRQFINFDQDFNKQLKKDKDQLKDTIKEIGNIFEIIKDFRNLHRTEQAIGILDKTMADDLDLNINDPDFYKQVVNETGYDYREDLKETHQNSNWFEFMFGSARDASDDILRMIYNIIQKVKQRIFKETLDFGKDLYDKAKSLGLDHTSMSWAYEEIDGMKTGRFVDYFKVTAWQQEKNILQKELFEELNIDSFETLRVWKEEYINAKPGDKLSKGNKYKHWRSRWGAWHKLNTNIKPNADQIVADVYKQYQDGLISEEQYLAWREANIGISLNGREYYKGTLVEPSDRWANDKYYELTDNQRKFLAYIEKIKLEIDGHLPNIYDSSLAPQITESIVDIFHKKNKKLFRDLGENIKDTFVTKADDEKYFGQKFVKRPDGSIQKFVPTYYTKLLGGREENFKDRLVETNKISTDLISAMIAYKEMQASYTHMSKIAPEMDLIQEQVGKRTMLDKSGQELPDEKNITFKKLNHFLEVNLYGRSKELMEVNAFGKKINVTKAITKFSNYVRANNLAWNFFTTFSNMVQGTVASRIEDLVAQFTTNKSKLFAEKEFRKNLSEIIKESFDINKRNKLSLIMERFQISEPIHGIFNNLDKSKLTKKAVDSGLYFSYQWTDVFIKGKLVLAVLDNHRLYNDKYYTKQEFDNLKIDVDFYSLPSAYDRLEVKGNKLVSKDMDNILDRLARKTQYLANQLDGKVNPEDYGAAHSHAIFSMVTIHRNWLFSGLSRRWKKKGYNYTANQMDEGYYRTSTRFLNDTLFSKERVKDYADFISRWKELSDIEKAAIKRTMWEFAFTVGAIVLAKTLNNLADEEDEYKYDIAAYLSNRVLLEISAFVPPFIITEGITTIKDPLVPLRLVEQGLDIGDIFTGGDEIERGRWEGFTKREKAIYRLIPGIKSATLWNDPSGANEFLKQKPLTVIYD